MTSLGTGAYIPCRCGLELRGRSLDFWGVFLRGAGFGEGGVGLKQSFQLNTFDIRGLGNLQDRAEDGNGGLLISVGGGQ